MDLIIPTYLLNSIYGFVWKYNHHFIFFSLALVIVDVLKTHFNHNKNSTLVDSIKREEHSIHLGACLLRYVSPTWLETPWGQRPCLPCLYYVSGSGPEPAPNRHSINTLAWKYKSPTSQSLSNKSNINKGRENTYWYLFLFSHKHSCFICTDPEEFSMDTTVLLHALIQWCIDKVVTSPSRQWFLPWVN